MPYRMASSTLRTVAVAFLATATNFAWSAQPVPDRETVGRKSGDRTVLPVHQVVTPEGTQTDLPGLRPQALALSPDGQLLAVSGKTSELLLLDPVTGAIKQKVPLPAEGQSESQPSVPSANILKPDTKGQLSFTGLLFSADGRRIFLSNVNGSIKVFTVAEDHSVKPSHSFALPHANAPRRKEEIPAGLALSRDSKRLYVCGNLSNKLLELDADTGTVLRTFHTGALPFDVLLLKDKAYVSNWGGRRPGTNDLTGPAGRGTKVRVDPIRQIASEGSVSIVDLGEASDTHATPVEVMTGLHASALALSPDQRWLVCANAGSDTLSAIDTRTGGVAETIWVKPKPSDLFGASPNALAFAPDGRTLYVANGTQNAVAVIEFRPDRKRSRLMGLIPVGWFPGAIAFDERRQQLCVANIKGHSTQAKPYGDAPVKGAAGFNTHQYNGSVSLVPLPRSRDLPRLSQVVADNYHRERITESLQKPRANQPARAIPERIGEPSLIRHVVYIIKENRTYDQVLGDITTANGDPRLCIFGEKITPNLHKLVGEFPLLDNTYCAGILSADGHQWSTSAFGTDYLERSFAGWPRSYPDGMGRDERDAMAYSPAGFLWDNALRHKIAIRNYGEFMEPKVGWNDPKKKGEVHFLDAYQTWKGETNSVHVGCAPVISTIRPFSPTNTVGWEMTVPDQFRADFVIRELKQYEESGRFPGLVFICLPNDHTSGTSKGSPTPSACVADNDLAFGRIVEALSHSRFWKEMAIFAIEDDPQAGFDHVSGYRTTAYVASPYARRKTRVSTQFNTISILRTIEQIHGLPPMNQFDAAATPMFDCFTNTPDFTAFEAVPNNIPLDQMNPDPKAQADAQLRRDAYASARMNFHQADRAPEDALNRILWRAVRGSREPYPEWAITEIGGRDRDDD